MDFSKMRNRIIFLKPSGSKKNTVHENVTQWVPFKPTVKNDESSSDNSVYLSEGTDGIPVLVYNNGVLFTHAMAMKQYAVWANVAPMTGREYQESQKIRAETTYNITTRYFPGITTDMKILYGVKVFDIVSVLNINECNVELKIVASEIDKNGKS